MPRGGGGKDRTQRRLEDCVTPSALEAGGTPLQRQGKEMAAKARDGVADPPEPDLMMLLNEIRAFRKDTSQQLGALNIRLDLAQARADALAQKLTEAEQRVADLEAALAPMAELLKGYKTDIHQLQLKQEDAEGRSRRCNLRLVGLPERIVPARMEPFMEDLVRKLLPDAQLSNMFVIERAHRALGQKPAPGAPPRSIIFKLLNYRDRDSILSAARVTGALQWEGARVSLYPDLTPAVQKARKQFDTAKAELRKRSTQYAMLYPAKLRIVHNGKTLFFTTPGDVWAHLEATGGNNNTVEVERVPAE